MSTSKKGTRGPQVEVDFTIADFALVEVIEAQEINRISEHFEKNQSLMYSMMQKKWMLVEK